ncbi:MAG: acyl carrier protein [bacterium]
MDFRSDIKVFLTKQSPKGVTFSDQDSLLSKGVIDSLKMLDLISFIEQHFGVKIDEDEMMPDNFESVDAIVSFVQDKRRAVDA